jgi:2-polyprenyl-6-methoxyphenol hydroxylase-like FAD-dependent oxidoreductase
MGAQDFAHLDAKVGSAAGAARAGIVGGVPTGLMIAGELALARVDVAIIERRESQDLAGSRAGGLHARTIEILDQRGIADRFLSQGQVGQGRELLVHLSRHQ